MGESNEYLLTVSSIPQGSVLGPVMFVIYINDLPTSVKHALVRIFADNTKMYKEVPWYAVHSEVQSDLNELENWSDRWQIGFNKGKCNVMHLGYNNPKYTYYMSGDTHTRIPLIIRDYSCKRSRCNSGQ